MQDPVITSSTLTGTITSTREFPNDTVGKFAVSGNCAIHAFVTNPSGEKVATTVFLIKPDENAVFYCFTHPLSCHCSAATDCITLTDMCSDAFSSGKGIAVPPSSPSDIICSIPTTDPCVKQETIPSFTLGAHSAIWTAMGCIDTDFISSQVDIGDTGSSVACSDASVSSYGITCTTQQWDFNVSNPVTEYVVKLTVLFGGDTSASCSVTFNVLDCS